MPVTRILDARSQSFAEHVPVLVVGAGAAGMVAGLAAKSLGADVLLLERDDLPSGNTALSSGLIPAANTRFQRVKGIEDEPDVMIADIMNKNGNAADSDIVKTLCVESASALEWLADAHGIQFEVLEGFLYPGHTRIRMHATPGGTGSDLMACLRQAAKNADLRIRTNAHVTGLFANDMSHVQGVRITEPDNSTVDIGCDAIILACNGFAGNAELVARYIPEMSDALYFGHKGNQGDALLWGTELGAATRHLAAYQGHGSVAVPQMILITWALMMEGGIQININGERFSNEHHGYSEQAVEVLRQPGKIAWNVYDGRIHELGMAFERYRDAQNAGAVLTSESLTQISAMMGVPFEKLRTTMAQCESAHRGEVKDPFGRDFRAKPALASPYYAVRVAGSLFHTQGGLAVNTWGQVLRGSDQPLPNLFAAGGAACGVSGPEAQGYLSGNGLLSAVVLGRICGKSAAELAGNGKI